VSRRFPGAWSHCPELVMDSGPELVMDSGPELVMGSVLVDMYLQSPPYALCELI